MYYDKQVDALYIEFKKLTDGSAKVKELSDSIAINYDMDGKIAGIEILDASNFMDNLDEAKLFEQNYGRKEVVYA